MVKAVVDLGRDIMVLDAEMHADQRPSSWLEAPDNRIYGVSTSIRIFRRAIGSSSIR